MELLSPFEHAMTDGLSGDKYSWDDAKKASMDFLASVADDLSHYKEKDVVYAVKNIIMVAHAMQSIINDNITDASMPLDKTFEVVTELLKAERRLEDKENAHMHSSNHHQAEVV